MKTKALCGKPIPIMGLYRIGSHFGNYPSTLHAAGGPAGHQIPVAYIEVASMKTEKNPTTAKRTNRTSPAPKQVVAGLIVREDGENGRQILICQRTRHQSMPLKWEFPGGKIETAEQPRDALRRELEEELGIIAEIGEEKARIRHNYGNGTSVELRFYLVPRFEGELENRIFQQIVWERLADLPKRDFLEADVELVNRLATGRLMLH